MPGDDAKDLKTLIRSQHPIIVLETTEERRAQQLFAGIAISLSRPLHGWSSVLGLHRCDVAQSPSASADMQKPADMLNVIRSTREAGIYLLFDFHPYLDEPDLVRLVKEIALDQPETPHTLVMVSHDFDIPPELRPFATRFELSMPDDEALLTLVQAQATKWSQANKGLRVRSSRKALDKLVMNLKGLTVTDARRLARGAIFEDGAITESDIPAVGAAKYELLDQSGALSFEYDTARFSEVGGLSVLTRWLERRRSAFLEPGDSMDAPKGLLLVGVQGCGKSLAAKAVAGMWSVPLLRLDFGTLFNKFFGETEKNMRSALKTAEAMSPCVLWIDEIEKAIAQGDYDSGTSRRMLGTLLTWMAENKQQVFIVATANDITSLPPELIRKGRMDEIFWVDLPNPEVRETIFRIHLERRNQVADGLDMAALVEATSGFSGAEIEQAVVSSIYYAKEQRQPLGTAHLLEEISSTRPLSVVMDEKITAMRAWAQERCVSADG